jgi:hypothetical protein
MTEILETLFVNAAVLFISAASALGLGHLCLTLMGLMFSSNKQQ